MRIKISKRIAVNHGKVTDKQVKTSFNPYHTFYIIHPQTRKPCAVLARPTGRMNDLGVRMMEVILPYTPRERLFGRRKFKHTKRNGKTVRQEVTSKCHTVMINESKFRNLMLTKKELAAFLKAA